MEEEKIVLDIAVNICSEVFKNLDATIWQQFEAIDRLDLVPSCQQLVTALMLGTFGKLNIKELLPE